MKKYNEEEFMSEWGDVQLTLTSYYKYSFGYSGEKDGKIIYVSVGGSSDDIYRFEPAIQGTTPLHELLNGIGVNYASIYENKVQIAEYHGSNW